MKRFFFFLLLSVSSLFANDALPRRIVGFWDSHTDKSIDDSLIHRILEMPLNHLGYDVIYYDIQLPLPDLSQRNDILGILVSFNAKTKAPKAKIFIQWLIQALDRGKKIVILNNPGFTVDSEGNFTHVELQNRLFEKMGFTSGYEWINFPFDYKILSSSNELFPFELDLPFRLPGFYRIKTNPSVGKSYLKLGIPGKPETETDLIIIGPHGAFIANYYATNYDPIIYLENPRGLGWYINPFRFLELAFGFPLMPIPDTTTLAGKRIFFATCHGDAWNIETEIEKYKKSRVLSSDVLLEEIIKPHPEIPTSVGIVAADIDPKWVGKPISQEIARKYLSLPQVEAGSHSYSHPFFWEFFKTGGPEKEINYLHLYPYGTWQNSYLSWFRAQYYQQFKPDEYSQEKLKWGYVIPREYANEPFNLDKEIFGSVEYINQFAPPENPVKIYLWPGDSRPWDTPVELCYKAGIMNMGGGFVRYDEEYPSLLYVFPLGRKPGGWIQPYATANADNNYTHGWTNEFYRFQLLPATLKNTGSPRRLKPLLLYYHSYSGEFLASVNALLSNIEYIQSQFPIAINCFRYCEIAEGFYSTEIVPLGPNSWKIRSRNGLQTVRFDKIKNLNLDVASSSGVIGFNEHQGSLYIYLDKAIAEPVVSLKQSNQSNEPHLIESSWEVWNLKRSNRELSFFTQGWGKLLMNWKVPLDGSYSLKANSLSGDSKSLKVNSHEGQLYIELDLPFNSETHIEIKAGGDSL